MIPAPIRLPYTIAAQQACRFLSIGHIVYLTAPKAGESVLLIGPVRSVAAYIVEGKIKTVPALRDFSDGHPD